MSARNVLRGAGHPSRGRLPAGSLLVAAVLVAALAGCSAQPPELGRDAARQLQSQVLAVTQAAAANDPSGSLKLLDDLVVKLDNAAARGEVSFKRHQRIRTSIEAVRADLTAQQAAAAEAARVAAEQEAAAQAAAKAADAASAAVIAPAPSQQNPVKGGKAKGKDKDG